jgi:hypothetical protein
MQKGAVRVKQIQSEPVHSGSSSEKAPAACEGAGGAGDAPEAEIAAQATRLIMQSHGAVVADADVIDLERAVLGLVRAAQSLRRYPLDNSDEPMTVNGRGPREWA